MRYKLLILFVIFLVSCKKKPDLPIFVIGHAGMGLKFLSGIYHDNSKEAMQLANETPNLDGVEVDVQMAKDGTLWLFHDPTMKKETNSDGCLAEKAAEELASVHYKTIKKEKLTRLDDVEFFQSGNQILFLDIKHYNACQSSIVNIEQFLKSLEKWSLQLKDGKSRVKIVISNPDWLSEFIQKGWSVFFSSDDSKEVEQSIKEHPSLSGVMMRNQSCSEKQVSQFKSQGKEIYLYEVRSPKELKQVRKKEPNGVLSDDVQGAIIEFK